MQRWKLALRYAVSVGLCVLQRFQGWFVSALQWSEGLSSSSRIQGEVLNQEPNMDIKNVVVNRADRDGAWLYRVGASQLWH